VGAVRGSARGPARRQARGGFHPGALGGGWRDCWRARARDAADQSAVAIRYGQAQQQLVARL
jgi:hypothetical protein